MNVPAQTVQFEITDLQPTFLDYIQSQKDENTRTFNIQFLFEGDVLSLSGCTATATVTINNIMVEQELDCEVNETNNYVTVVVNAPYSGVMAVQVTLTDGTNTLTMPRPLFVRVARDIAETAQIDDNTHGSFAEVVREVADARGNYATLAQAINAKMDVNDATVYHVDTTTQTLTYDNTNPKTIYLNARVSYGSVSNRTAVVISTSSKGYQFAVTVTGDILMRSGGGTYPTDWTVLYGSSYKKNVINDDNKNSFVFIPTIGAVVSYLAANYIGNGSGTVTENNLATALKNSLYHVDNTTETVAYSADNPRTIYTNARVNGNKPTLVFTLGDDSQLAMYKDGHLYCRTYANGAYGSWIDLKAMSIGESNKTSGAYPTVQAVYNFVTAFVASAISGKESASNKLTSEAGIDEDSTDTEYPTAKAVFNFGTDILNEVAGDLVLKESFSNKKTTITGYETSNQFYPTTKAVYDYVASSGQNVEAIPHSVKLAMDTLFSKAAYADDDAASSYATFHAWVISNPVTFITAVFTQGSATIYYTDSLNMLKQYLTVTATYSDGTTATVTDYTLSGTLTEGTSTITVSYGGKTTTFTVTVSGSIPEPVSGAYAIWDARDYSTGTAWADRINTIALTPSGNPAKSGNAVLFDGTDDYFTFGSRSIPTSPGVTTIQVSFKLENLTKTAFVMVDDVLYSSAIAIALRPQDGVIRILSGDKTIDYSYVFDSAWHLLTAVLVTTGQYIYIDNTLLEHTTTVFDNNIASRINGSSALLMGAYRVYDGFSNMSLRALYIYPKTLDATDVSTNYFVESRLWA